MATPQLSDLGLGARVSQAVAAAIEASGLTQHAVAEQAGIPRETFRRRINGHASFSVDQLAAVAAVLDVEPATFVIAAEGEAVA